MPAPIDIAPAHLEIVRDILRAHVPRDVRVWVFGSRASWTAKEFSDLDLALEGAGQMGFASLSFAGAGDNCLAAFEEFTGLLFAKIKANGQKNLTLAVTCDLLLPKFMSVAICMPLIPL